MEDFEKINTAVSASDLLHTSLRLVPLEPTPLMIRAALDCQDADPEDSTETELYHAYRAMLNAAPAALVPAYPVGYLIQSNTGKPYGFSTTSHLANGELPPGWSEEALFTVKSAQLPLKEAAEPRLPEMSPQLFKVFCEALVDENPVLTQEHAEELATLLSAVMRQQQAE